MCTLRSLYNLGDMLSVIRVGVMAPPMDKLRLTGQNLGRVFNFRFGHLHAEHFWCYLVQLPNLKLKTQPKQLLGSLPLVIAFPASPYASKSLFFFFSLQSDTFTSSNLSRTARVCIIKLTSAVIYGFT
jgi:hypothetical protein